MSFTYKAYCQGFNRREDFCLQHIRRFVIQGASLICLWLLYRLLSICKEFISHWASVSGSSSHITTVFPWISLWHSLLADTALSFFLLLHCGVLIRRHSIPKALGYGNKFLRPCDIGVQRLRLFCLCLFDVSVSRGFFGVKAYAIT